MLLRPLLSNTPRMPRRWLCRRGTAACSLVTVLALAVALAPRRVAAQPVTASRSPPESTTQALEAKPVSVYLSAGLGASNVGPALHGLLTVATGPWFVALNAGYAVEFTVFSGPSPELEQKEFGAVAGLHHRGSFYVASVGAGLGYVRSINRGSFLRMEDGLGGQTEVFEKVDRAGVGIPIVAHGALHYGTIGLGALLFANANLTLPSLGGAVTLELGVF